MPRIIVFRGGIKLPAEGSFVWKINNFSANHNNFEKEFSKSQILISPSPSGNPIKWHIKITAHSDVGYNSRRITRVFIGIELIEAPTEKVSAKISFAIKNSLWGMNERLHGTIDREFSVNEYWYFDRGVGVVQSTLFKILNGFFHRDLLTIVCDINVHGEETVNNEKEFIRMSVIWTSDRGDCLEQGGTTIQQSDHTVDIPNRRMLENMGKMFKESSLTDCRIIVENKEFEVHKAILASESSVFLAMFQNEMEENKNGIVKIDDIQAEIVEQMLEFIYNGTAPKLEEMPRELMAAAHKYDIGQLKALCELSLVNSIENENACELLVLADLHLAEQLKARAINYIQTHKKEVMETEGWKMLKANYGKLFGEIVELLILGQN